MALFKKPKKDDGKKKPVKVVPIDVNGPKNARMWCPMHGCTKLACPEQHD